MPMRKRFNTLVIVGAIVLAFCFGFVVSKMIDFPQFKISESIDLVNVLSVLVTVALALLITFLFDKIKSDNRIEKDLIMKRVDNVYELVNDIQKDVVGGSIEYTEAASMTKRIYTSMTSIYRTIDKCQFSIKDDIKVSIKNSIKGIKNILTDTPRIDEEKINGSALQVEVKDGVIHYNRELLSRIDAKFDELKDLLLELELRINKK